MGLPTVSEAPTTGGLDSKSIATMRLVLSSSVLFIIGPLDLSPFPGAFHAFAALYTAYSALLCMFAGRRVYDSHSKLLCWADVGWAALLIAFSDDSTTAFLLLFPLLIASFQWGFTAAIHLTVFLAILLAAIEFLKLRMGSDLLLPEILLPPSYLLVFGYLVACWGDREIAAKHRLVLLKEINRLSNPRFGVDRTIGTMMERLRVFYRAEACLIVTYNPAANTYLLRRADYRDAERAIEPEPIPAEVAQLLLAPPTDQALLYLGAQHAWPWQALKSKYYVYDLRKGQRTIQTPAANDPLITAVDARSFISVPLHYPTSTTGRLYLTAARRRAFSSTDVGFLLQVIEQVLPVLENIRLVDQLASSAAEEERRRLARDIHDNVLQPYIGFQIGLAAVHQKLQAGADIANDIAQLMTITDQGINSLRRYMHRLPGAGKSEQILLTAVQRFAATFTDATHIAVRVDATPDLYINDRLAAEVFQMVVEGLSNIRRHTRAVCVCIELESQNSHLILRIANDGGNGSPPARFMPRSITERAMAIGGRVRVESISGQSTQVIVEIPL